jgi:hypothetical protein
VISFDGSTPTPVRDRERTERLIEELVSANALAPRRDSSAVLDDDDFLLSDETLDVPPAESPLRRYLLYQIRDFVKQRGAWMLAVGLLGIYFVWDNFDPSRSMQRPMRNGVARNPMDQIRDGILIMGTGFAFLSSVFATHGIVSAERERGLQRFLFAKPIARIPYYLQKLGIAFVGTLVLTAVLTSLAGLVFGVSVPLASALSLAVALFASVGGLTFLLSTLVRFEGGLALMASLAVIPLRAIATETDLGAWRLVGSIRYLLPPIERLGPLVDPNELGDPLRAVLWALAYGAVYITAGLMVLRRRSILT